MPMPLIGSQRPADGTAYPEPPEVNMMRYHAEDAYAAPDAAGYAPRVPDETDEYDEEEHRQRVRLIAVLAVLGLLTLMTVVYFFFPRSGTSLPAKVRTPLANAVDSVLGIAKSQQPRIIKFEAAEPNGMVGVHSVFTITTDVKVDWVGLYNEAEEEIPAIVRSQNEPANTLWTVEVLFDKPYQGKVMACVRKDNTWYREGKSVEMNIAQPTPVASLMPAATPEPLPEAPDLPENEGVGEDTAEPNGEQTGDTPAAAGEQTGNALAPLTQGSQSLSVVGVAPQGGMSTPPPFMPSASVVGAAPAVSADDAGVKWVDGEAVDPDAAEDEDGEAVDPDAAEDEGGEALDPDAADPDAAPKEETASNTPVVPAVAMAPAQPQGRVAAPKQTPLPAFDVAAADAAAPKKFKYADSAYTLGKKHKTYQRETPLNMFGLGGYTSYEGGVFTFRGDAMHKNAAFGTVPQGASKLSQLWSYDLGSLNTSTGRLYGMGWTGQPAIVKWSKELREAMPLTQDKKQVSPLKEVIAASQDGKVHFVDLNDGVKTREPIAIGFPLKGSVSVDPQGQPLIAFGQGVSKLSNKTGKIGLHVYSLLTGKQLSFIDGRKSKTQSQFAVNGAFDGTPVFDRTADTMVVAGENGLLYTVKMNTNFDYKDPAAMKLAVKPEITYQKSKGSQKDANTGMEASVAMAGKVAFVADKQGFIRAVDTTTLKTLWVFDAGDNTDATPALDMADGKLTLFTGTTVAERTKGKKQAVLRALDALTGEELWQYKVGAQYNKDERSGVKASPIVGEQGISHLVIFTVNMVEDGGATVLAMDKRTGQVVWERKLTNKTISSPVAVYDETGKASVIQGDESGRLTMMDGATGEVINALELGGKIEASPAVYNDILVVGTAGKDAKLFGVRIE